MYSIAYCNVLAYNVYEFMIMGFVLIALVVTLENDNKDNDYYNGRTNLSFLVVGDWGGQSTPPFYTQAQKDVAQQMGIKANETNSQFTVSLGDNFYELGVTGVDDPRFNTTFEVRRCCMLRSIAFSFV